MHGRTPSATGEGATSGTQHAGQQLPRGEERQAAAPTSPPTTPAASAWCWSLRPGLASTTRRRPCVGVRHPTHWTRSGPQGGAGPGVGQSRPRGAGGCQWRSPAVLRQAPRQTLVARCRLRRLRTGGAPPAPPRVRGRCGRGSASRQAAPLAGQAPPEGSSAPGPRTPPSRPAPLRSRIAPCRGAARADPPASPPRPSHRRQTSRRLQQGCRRATAAGRCCLRCGRPHRWPGPCQTPRRGSR